MGGGTESLPTWPFPYHSLTISAMDIGCFIILRSWFRNQRAKEYMHGTYYFCKQLLSNLHVSRCGGDGRTDWPLLVATLLHDIQ